MHLHRLIAGCLLAILAAVAATAQVANVKTVFIIVMENHNWSSFKGSPSAPYINGTLLPQASHAEQYFNPPNLHPSLPNYLWLEAGTNFGIFNDSDPSVNHQSTTSHLVTQLKNANVTWKTYQEDIGGTNCPLTSVNKYAPKHNPFVYFDDVTDTNNVNSAYCIAHVRPYAELATDLQNNAVAQYVFITPNLCDDGHDSCAPVSNPIKQTDNWLASEVPKILKSAAYQNGGAVFITWDEGVNGDGPIGMIALSPLAKGGGYSNSIHYTHGSMLRTVETIFAVSLLGDAAVQADLSDFFGTPALPAAPANLVATGGDAQVMLTWMASAGASSYNISRSQTDGGPYTTVASGVIGGSYEDLGLTNGTAYYYRVAGVNASGEGAASTQATATPNFAVPAPPTNLNASPGDSTVALGWTVSSGAVSYNVYRSTVSGSFGSTPLAAGLGSTSYNDNTALNGTTYYYVVTAVNGGGESGFSNQAAATPVGANADFTISASPSSITVTRGKSAVYTVTVASQQGFGGTVKLSVTGLPSRSNATISPSSLTGGGTSALTVKTNKNSTVGSYTLTISGVSGSLNHSTTVTLKLQ